MTKSEFKEFLWKYHLLEPARFFYSFFKGATPRILLRELGYRLGESHAPWPFPPARLMYKVISTRWVATFQDSGEAIVAAMEAALQRTGNSLAKFGTVLDFGCGCGRLMRHLPKYTKAELFGCDYNPEFIRWCTKHLPIAKFATNTLTPPLPYDAAAFDFVYARSVFTHLTEEGQAEWFRELARVLKPGGTAYVTMHGEQFFGELTPEERDRVKNGEIIVRRAVAQGRNLCTSFELDGYIGAHLPPELSVALFVPGIDHEHLKQDGYVITKASSN